MDHAVTLYRSLASVQLGNAPVPLLQQEISLPAGIVLREAGSIEVACTEEVEATSMSAAKEKRDTARGLFAETGAGFSGGRSSFSNLSRGTAAPVETLKLES
mmetsp:Transcript_7952/g.19033  ORF Transcript_7952/g.19033 Transcript_7952/m.19033 type:complete len:102 (-) Transcript_7952:417-722(-)